MVRGDDDPGLGTAGGSSGSTARVALPHIADREAKMRREEALRGLSWKVKDTITSLESLDRDHAALEAQFRRERRELERKYEKLYAPVYARRAELISGSGESSIGLGPGDDEGPGVPDFWLRAMKSAAAISANITPQDEKILRFLQKIECTTLPESDGIGFRLEFSFAPNEFFSNSALSKVYYLADTDDCPVLDKALGTEIQWKPGKNATIRVVKRKTKNGKTAGKVITRREPCGSFFNFFSTLEIPEVHDLDLDGETFERKIDEIEADYEMGMAFKEKIVPHAVRWFTGEAEDDDEYEDEQEDDRKNFLGDGDEEVVTDEEPDLSS